jgi:hypothetical protein
MSASEIATITRQYRERILALLTDNEIAQYDAYEQRVQAQIDAHNLEPVDPIPAEQTVLDKIAADERAAALHKQLMVLLRIETLPQ